MPPKCDGNITSFSQTVDSEKSKKEAEKPVADSESNSPEATTKKYEEKGKGKRTYSSPPPNNKRRETKLDAESSQTYFSSKDLSPDWLSRKSENTEESTPTNLSITVHKGDLFQDAPEDTLLIHACNTQGSWGAGIARAFRDRYPKAYVIYRNFCIKEYDPKTNPIPTGTALLIPPVDEGKKHWIGCLFTSAKYGKAKAKPEVILRDTLPAMQMLLGLVNMAGGVGEVRMCKINSGLFAVPWEKTAEVLEGIEVQEGWKANIAVWEP